MSLARNFCKKINYELNDKSAFFGTFFFIQLGFFSVNMYNDDDDDEEYLCYREIDGAVGEFHDVYGYSTSDPFNTSFTNTMSDLASSPQQCSNLNFIAQPSTSADNISSPFHFNNGDFFLHF